MLTTLGSQPIAWLVYSLFIMLGLVVYVMGTHASGQRRHPSAALAWVLTITLLPYLGLPLYLLLGTRKFIRPQAKPLGILSAHPSNLQGAAMVTLEGMGLASAMNNQSIQFHEDGQAAWDALTALVSGAQHTLDICTFLLGNDPLGKRLVELLDERARAGVRIRLLLDAFGSRATSRSDVQRLRTSGVQVHWYMPLLHNPLRGQLNLRNHRKLAIADGQHLWSGGRNFADEYFLGKPNQKPWVDLTFNILGPVATQAQMLFNSRWPEARNTAVISHIEVTQPPANPHLVGHLGASNTRPHIAQIVPSGPDQSLDTFYGLLLTALYRAEKQVRIVTPYFVPDDALLTALCLAAQRGVQIELVVPRHSNHRMADIARARALRDLASSGGRVLLAPGMVHAKAILIDNSLAFCGSLNLDSRSLFLNFELMVAFYSPEDIAALSEWMNRNFGGLPTLQPTQPTLLRDTGEGLVRWLGFQI